MAKVECKVSIKGSGLTFEQDVPLDLAKRLVALAAGTPAVPLASIGGGITPPTGTPAPSHGGPDALALSEYLAQHGAKRNIEKITAIAEYLRVHRQKLTFKQSDLEGAFEEAGEGVPGNLPRDITWAKKAQWIAPKLGAEGEYYVTQSGRSALSQKFSDDVKAKSKASAGGRKKKAKNAAKA